ncbi:hypothetical protein DMC30DRAFT_447570, partial [Rhodotorula diobovata]
PLLPRRVLRLSPPDGPHQGLEYPRPLARRVRRAPQVAPSPARVDRLDAPVAARAAVDVGARVVQPKGRARRPDASSRRSPSSRRSHLHRSSQVNHRIRSRLHLHLPVRGGVGERRRCVDRTELSDAGELRCVGHPRPALKHVPRDVARTGICSRHSLAAQTHHSQGLARRARRRLGGGRPQSARWNCITDVRVVVTRRAVPRALLRRVGAAPAVEQGRSRGGREEAPFPRPGRRDGRRWPSCGHAGLGRPSQPNLAQRLEHPVRRTHLASSAAVLPGRHNRPPRAPDRECRELGDDGARAAGRPLAQDARLDRAAGAAHYGYQSHAVVDRRPASPRRVGERLGLPSAQA